MSFRLYSIESRKGGVGKTTIALNLAKVLLNKGPVLLIDCDITGTSISEPATNSPFWEKECKVLKDENGQILNLLRYFIQKYSRGESEIDKLINEHVLVNNKINIIGSDIYFPNYQSFVDSRLLMDELHSYWMKEFMHQIICNFEKAFPNNTVHIIIDNSPGYVGLCQTLHNYMYSLGPDKAKFVIVSSIDAQDLQACISAAQEINEAIEDRYECAKFFNEANQELPTNKEIEELLNRSGDLKRFFIRLSDEEQLRERYKGPVKEVASYLSLVLNKVPQRVAEGYLEVDYPTLIHDEKKSTLFQRIASASGSNDPQSIVYYDEAISFQYFQKYLIYHSKEKEGDENSYWKSRFKSLDQQNRDWMLQDDRRKAANTLNLLYDNLIKSLLSHGYKYIATSLEPEWAPMYSLEGLKTQMDSWSDSLNLIPTDHFTSRISEHLHLWNEHIIKEMREVGSLGNQLGNLKGLIQYLESVGASSKEDQPVAMRLLLSVFLHAATKKIIMEKSPVADIREYLKEQAFTPMVRNSWRAYLRDVEYVYKERVWISDIMCPKFEKEFESFNMSFCYALLRMIDVHNDFDAVLKTVQLYVPASDLSVAFSDELKNYLSSVIFSKKSSFDSDRAMGIKTQSLTMERIQKMVNVHIISKWQ